jgi:hypothetical protein
MTTYCYRNGRVVKKTARHYEQGSVSIIRDEMDATRHMADGKMYTSKAKFRQATRDAGCIEVGNDPAALRPRRATMPTREERRVAIRQSVRNMLRNGIPRQ